MLRPKVNYALMTERLGMRLPILRDHAAWADIRSKNEDYLAQWEPKRKDDQNTAESFRDRVRWSRRMLVEGTAVPYLIFRLADEELLGGITLHNIRRGPAQAATVGYWLGKEYAGNGYMQEALTRLVAFAFTDMDLSRIEAATLEHNQASRKVLERAGFRYEGVAQAYLQINGRWRPHVLYANLRRDRIGTTNAGTY